MKVARCLVDIRVKIDDHNLLVINVIPDPVLKLKPHCTISTITHIPSEVEAVIDMLEDMA
jgi:hypothetical protein